MPIFLFTDIESSTSLWQKYPAHMGAVIARHDSLLGGLIEKHGGRLVKNTGDGLFAIFEMGEPLACALEMEKEIAYQDWGPLGELRVRVALHTGDAVRRGDDYFGLDINRTVRLLTAGWGGQVLLTCELARAVPLPEGAAFLDLGIHTLKDLSEPQHIFALDHPDLPVRTFPPLRTLSAHPHNLPPQPTPFVGRADDLAAISSRLMEPTCRLLTLVGPGGIGKTRLALQSAAGQVEAFRHGVYFVPLAPLAAGDLLVPAIAEALRFTFYQRDNPRTQLLNYLREKNILLVMDNFEHLIAAAGLVSEILTAAPQVRVLATSRERLNLREEQVFLVEGMRFPEGNQEEGLDDFSSVKLFLQSARRLLPGFELIPGERPCVARICRLVQGTPLGIELAAGWLRSLSCQEIANEIEASLDFLESGLRDIPDRHRSLRAVFDYSWTLLPEAERRTLMRLSVFLGSFQREAAEAVLDLGPGTPRQALLTQMAALVDKSLLRRNTDNTYELHSLMRGYALERLAADPSAASHTRDLHAAYFIGLLTASESGLRGREQPKALRQVAASLDDIRAAWLWALSQGRWEMADVGLNILHLFFNLRSREEEAVHLFEEARNLLHQSHSGSERLSLRVDIRFAAACAAVSQFEEARPVLDTSLESAREMELPAEVALAHVAMGRIAWMGGDYQKSTFHDREALEIYRQLKRMSDTASCLDRLGISSWSMGDYVSAYSFMQESLELFKQEGAPIQIARVLDHLGVVARDEGNMDSARVYFLESRDMLDGLEAASALAFVTNHLAGITLMSGQIEEAVAQFEDCIALSREIGDQRALAYALCDLGSIMLGQPNNLERARALYDESQALFEAGGERFGSITASAGQAGVAFASGNDGYGLEKLKYCLDASLEIQSTRLVAETLTIYADFLHDRGRYAEAAETLGFLLTEPSVDLSAVFYGDDKIERIKSSLPAGDVEAALARGRALGLDGIRSRLERE